jgi:hypothetical protein
MKCPSELTRLRYAFSRVEICAVSSVFALELAGSASLEPKRFADVREHDTRWVSQASIQQRTKLERTKAYSTSVTGIFVCRATSVSTEPISISMTTEW